MQQGLYEVICWIKERGDPRAFDRVRLKMLGHTLRERVKLEKVGEETAVSEGYYEAFVKTASEVVGESYS